MNFITFVFCDVMDLIVIQYQDDSTKTKLNETNIFSIENRSDVNTNDIEKMENESIRTYTNVKSSHFLIIWICFVCVN